MIGEQTAQQEVEKVEMPNGWNQTSEPKAELVSWQCGKVRSQQQASAVEGEELVLRQATLRVLEAGDSAPAAVCRLEEALVQRDPPHQSGRLRGLTGGAVLAYKGVWVAAKMPFWWPEEGLQVLDGRFDACEWQFLLFVMRYCDLLL